LLRFLQDELGSDAVTFAEAPRRMSGGAFTEVFRFRLSGLEGAWASPLVLRLYGGDDDRTQPRLEEAIQNGVAEAGFPAPRVLLAHCDDDVLHKMFVVMERVPGRPALRGIRWDQFIRDFPQLFVRWPATLARIAADLHEVDASVVLRSARTHGLEAASVSTRRHIEFVERQLDRYGGYDTSEALAWLQASEPSLPAVLSAVHGDLWPANVLEHRRRLSGVVDWNRAAVGDPALDIGFAKAGLALMPAPFPPPPPIAHAVHAAGRSMANRLQQAYTALHPMTDDRVSYYEALRCLVELAVVLAHRADAEQGITRGPRPPWENGIAALTKHFTTVTGVPLRV
jgi:aminoglycoside phosphotransferase (APT) family kinase protein